MTDLTAPPTDRATCGWLPLPAGPPPSPPPDRSGTRPDGSTASTPATTTGPPGAGHAPDPAAVQAAIETLTRWLRAGGMLVCAADDGPTDPGGAHPPDATVPAAPAAPTAPTPPAAPTGPAAATAPTGASCRHCRVSDDPVVVRAWARERGFRVADRGRLPAAVVAAYVAAHPHV